MSTKANKPTKAKRFLNAVAAAGRATGNGVNPGPELRGDGRVDTAVATPSNPQGTKRGETLCCSRQLIEPLLESEDGAVEVSGEIQVLGPGPDQVRTYDAKLRKADGFISITVGDKTLDIPLEVVQAVFSSKEVGTRGIHASCSMRSSEAD